ncbi:MAG: hypothetical protein ACKVPX_00250, partial [Myxococcaceae bacterium]
MAHFDRARAFARCGKLDLAYKALTQAVANGFLAFEKLDTEPDLSALRSSPERWSEMRKSLVRSTNPPRGLAGTLDVPGIRMSHSISHLCSNGTVVAPRSCGGYFLGKWSSENGDLSVRLLRGCEKVGEQCESRPTISNLMGCPKCKSFKINCH